MRSTKFLTPKEKNLLVRLQKKEHVNYTEFPEMLYNVRYELARSRMMEFDLNEIEFAIVREFMRFDKDDNGVINVLDCERALKNCKKISLTPLQIHVLLGLSDCDGDGLVPYKEFAKVCHEFI